MPELTYRHKHTSAGWPSLLFGDDARAHERQRFLERGNGNRGAVRGGFRGGQCNLYARKKLAHRGRGRGEVDVLRHPVARAHHHRERIQSTGHHADRFAFRVYDRTATRARRQLGRQLQLIGIVVHAHGRRNDARIRSRRGAQGIGQREAQRRDVVAQTEIGLAGHGQRLKSRGGSRGRSRGVFPIQGDDRQIARGIERGYAADMARAFDPDCRIGLPPHQMRGRKDPAVRRDDESRALCPGAVARPQIDDVETRLLESGKNARSYRQRIVSNRRDKDPAINLQPGSGIYLGAGIGTARGGRPCCTQNGFEIESRPAWSCQIRPSSKNGM